MWELCHLFFWVRAQKGGNSIPMCSRLHKENWCIAKELSGTTLRRAVRRPQLLFLISYWLVRSRALPV